MRLTEHLFIVSMPSAENSLLVRCAAMPATSMHQVFQTRCLSHYGMECHVRCPHSLLSCMQYPFFIRRKNYPNQVKVLEEVAPRKMFC